ncbi:MAG: NAD-dependent epimerase/dehydratase family protein [Planctomycetes bacterium]|nr:NAD-dependent epimerase/dehydratase family protein [Planctomycetota bacterium]
MRVLVSGAGGFIGHHLVKHLVAVGCWVRGADLKSPEYEPSPAHEFMLLDLRSPDSCLAAVQGVEHVYHLAADMGGIGYITAGHADIARNNALINAHMLEASRITGVKRFLFTSSACVYPIRLQSSPVNIPLVEAAAWPAEPEEGYGLEKLFAEKLCQYYREDHRLSTRIARLHNVYGPLGTYEGGKEKAPAAICRKVALAGDGGDVEVWGDGEQTRSFMYVADCVEGIVRIMQSDFTGPLNLGTEESLSINEMTDIVAAIAGYRISKKHDVSKPQGVRGRNSENSLLRRILGWEPHTPIREGLVHTFRWIRDELRRAGRIS